jgi:hypothetical protein
MMASGRIKELIKIYGSINLFCTLSDSVAMFLIYAR